MSTRRARIKAVTSLPPRRKNNEAVEKNKNKLSNTVVNTYKSPQSSKLNNSSNKDETRHGIEKNSSVIEQTNDKTKTSNVIEIPNILEKPPSSRLSAPVQSTEKENILITLLEKPQNISALMNASNVFASPLRRDSPKRTFASPALPSPKTSKNLDLQKSTPRTPIAQKINVNNELQITENNISTISHTTENSKKGEEDSSHLNNSLNDEAMDGIVPLQPAGAVPKPIDLLKSEIISENAEVLFDPIVPLPSPSKVRPKLRPAPRLGPNRRNSIQGSASESEDESRRNLQPSVPSRQRHDSQTSQSAQSITNRDVSRIRNDSVCSSVSQVTVLPAPTGSPTKEKSHRVNRRQDTSRRMTAMRLKHENVKRDSLTMYDLIFYNPTANPIVPDEEEINLKKANEKEEKEQALKKEEPKPKSPKNTPAPVPQIKLGPQGEIILDEESLVIKQTDSGRAVSSVVYEGGWSNNSFKYKRGPRTAEWPAAETVRFYRALAAIGTDFTLMAPLFPGRTRRELKFKFKKEEKINGAQVDKALRASIQWDVTNLKEEFNEERAAAAEQLRREKEILADKKKAERERFKSQKVLRMRKSKAAIAIESIGRPDISKRPLEIAVTPDDLIEQARLSRKRKPRQTPPMPNLLPITPNLPTLNNQKPQGIMSTPINSNNRLLASLNQKKSQDTENASISKLATPYQLKTPDPANMTPQIPANIETGSLVVLSVNDPSSPTKKMLQTYMAHKPGQLTPVALPATFLSSVVGYMKKNPKGTSTLSSPQLTSPNSVTSHDSRTSTPSVSFHSPVKRQRHSSYTITQL